LPRDEGERGTCFIHITAVVVSQREKKKANAVPGCPSACIILLSEKKLTAASPRSYLTEKNQEALDDDRGKPFLTGGVNA